MAEQVTTPSHPPLTPPRPPSLMAAKDLGLAVGLPLLFLAANLIPERSWRPLARSIAPHAAGILSRGRRELMEQVSAVMGSRAPDHPPQAVAGELVAGEIQRTFQIMASHLPGRWRPEIKLVGEGHVRAALQAGRGVILWDSHFCFASQITKMAFHRAGIAISHLSHPRHGFSSTRFGMAVLNPVQTRAEVRYLKERVLLSLHDAGDAMERLQARLGENGVISITVRDTGRRPLEISLMDARLRIAAGAPNLALKTGAALVPVFTVQEEDGGYTTTAEAPIEFPDGAPRAQALQAAAEDYARRLESYLMKFPGQWFGWINI